MTVLRTTTIPVPFLLAIILIFISAITATQDPPTFFDASENRQHPFSSTDNGRRPVIGPSALPSLRNDRAGGRCLSERLVVSEKLGLEIMVESGASIFVDENRNLVHAARDFGLTFEEDDDDSRLLDAHLGGSIIVNATKSEAEAASAMQVSIWNGTHTLFMVDLDGGWRSKFRGRLADAAAAKMSQVYSPGHRSYKSVDKLVDGLGLREETRVRMSEYVERMGINKRWADEVLEGVTRVNYGRDLSEVHVLAALAGFVKGPTYSVREGNQRIYEEFLGRSKARTYFNSTVTSIHPSSLPLADGYQITYTDTSTGQSTNSTSAYDTIVLALPPTASGLSAISLPMNSTPIPATPYHQVHVTFVLGKLNLTTFPNRPVQVLTTKSVKFIQSVSLVYDFGYQLADYGVGLYKVFSTVSLTYDGPWMRQLFSRVDKVWRRQWFAYPVMRPEQRNEKGFFGPLTVHEMRIREGKERKARVHYLNGMERMMSTMETATVASRNLVRVLVDEVLGEDGIKVGIARD
ncbi:Prenylcysteine lyase-domain-containing protein [Catenaria anguillulae PL171]|uniref:Prenylcysteine lyase-domain-containing protein n=1 Tax=Catenaria anguillulae PL171 TaxID=765915 RepID=A0A1Y2I157_9FUNG|nr:Prenylcysteine lyase-domain-containing protein [Catenaria anguillulae PL171]